MKHSLFGVFLVTAALSVLAGCRHEGAYSPKYTDQYDLENQAPFVLLDKMVQRSVTVSDIQERKLADGRLEVIANVRNREERRIQVEVDCVFKNLQGFPVDETPFKPLILTENAQEGVRFVSLSTEAEKFTIRVRQAR